MRLAGTEWRPGSHIGRNRHQQMTKRSGNMSTKELTPTLSVSNAPSRPRILKSTVILLLVLALFCSSAAASTFVEAGNMNSRRFVGTATLLPNAQVLLAGGGADPIFVNTASAEIYDPIEHAWHLVGSMSMPRVAHSATLLRNGKVLIASGSNNDTNVASCELYDPLKRRWSPTGSMHIPRFNHEAVLLRNGK